MQVNLASLGICDDEAHGSPVERLGLILRILDLALAFRSSGCAASRELRPDLATMNFLHELADVAARGGDIRARVFG